MKRKQVSIQYKIFTRFLLLTIVLLGVLWFFQIIYLSQFYKMIKRNETEHVLNQLEELVLNSDQPAQDIDELAAFHNMAIFVTDSEGKGLYNAEYITNSQMSSLPHYMFNMFYDEAVKEGGEAVINYEGSQMKENFDNQFIYIEGLEERPSEKPSSAPGGEKGKVYVEGKIPYTEKKHSEPEAFRQNIGNEMAESVIYVRIIGVEDSEVVLMVNSVLTPVDATVSTLKIQLYIISLIMVAVSFVISFFTSRSISKSIIVLNDGAKKLARGDYSVNFDSPEYKEMAELSDTLNFAASELEKTDSLQKELIANVSHDLRTPLTMIKGYAEVMRDLPGENTPENVQVIIDETEHLTGLVNDMLDISKLKAGTIEIKNEKYNFTSSVRNVLERYNKLREVEGYIIDFNYDRDIEIIADEQKIYQVIYNLVNNAINYTGDDKKVVVTQKLVEDKLRLEVKDSGNGVAPEDMPYVWDRYYKDKTHKRAVQGTGLGLSIVKSILDLHKAVYGVNSTVGQGATFWFELPLPEELE